MGFFHVFWVLGILFTIAAKGEEVFFRDDAAPCPSNWTQLTYSLRHIQPLPFEEITDVLPGAADVFVTAGVVAPSILVAIFQNGVVASWLAGAYLNLTFMSSTNAVYFTRQPLFEGRRARLNLRFDLPSESGSYSLRAANLTFDSGVWFPLVVSDFPRIRVLPSSLTASVVSAVRCRSFWDGNILSLNSPPIRAAVGMPLPPIRVAAFTTRGTQYRLFNVSLHVYFTVAGLSAVEEVRDVVTEIVEGEGIVSNIRFFSAVGNAIVTIDIPERLKTPSYPPRPFRFPVYISTRNVGVSFLRLHSSCASHWGLRTSSDVSPLVIHRLAALPPVLATAWDSSRSVVSTDATGALCFYDSLSGLVVGECYLAPVVGGVISFTVDRFDIGSRQMRVVGSVNVSGVLLWLNPFEFRPDGEHLPARLQWSVENEQFYSGSIPMIATSGLPMPPFRVFVLGSNSAVFTQQAGVANVTCEGRFATLLPLAGGVVSSQSGAFDFQSVVFTSSQTVQCLLKVTVSISSRHLVLTSEEGYLYASRATSVTLSMARHSRLSFFDDRLGSQERTAFVGYPLPQITFLVRNSDWSVDRSNTIVTISAASKGCAEETSLAVASGGEIQFTSLRLMCAGVSRFWFSVAEVPSASIVQQHIFTPIIVANERQVASRDLATTRIFMLSISIRGHGDLPLSQGCGPFVVTKKNGILQIVISAFGNDGIASVRGVGMRLVGQVVSLMSGVEVMPIRCLVSSNGTCWVQWDIAFTAEAEYAVRVCAELAPSVCTSGVLLVTNSLQGRPLVFFNNASTLIPMNEPQQLVLTIPTLESNRQIQASYPIPLQTAANESASTVVLSFPSTAGGNVVFPNAILGDDSMVTQDGLYAPLLSVPLGVGEAANGIHADPVRFVMPAVTVADALSVYVAGRYRTFNTGRWVEELAGFLQIEASRIAVIRVTDSYLMQEGISCVRIEVSFLNPTTLSAVKKSAKVARGELLGYSHTCSVSERLNILHVRPLQDIPSFCDAVALQELVDSARLCENVQGRDNRCDCFVPMARRVPSECASAVLVGAVCVHLSSCNDGDIHNMCATLRPDIAIQVIQVVLVTAAIMALSLCISNYSFILEYITTTRQRLRKSRIIGPRQHHDEVFITSL